MKLGKQLMKYLSKFKYVIVIIVGTLLITVIGENSMLQRYRYARQISDLEDEIEKQEARFVHDSLRLAELERNPEAIRKIARERYFMKADDEDIYVFSDEIAEEGSNEAAQ
jgi:cell division protein FtsB